MDLDLARITPPSATPGARYGLCSVVEHHGKGVGEGHYTALGKHSPTGTWLSFNDARVNIINDSDVLACQGMWELYWTSVSWDNPSCFGVVQPTFSCTNACRPFDVDAPT
jgi:Ubiquitin carboxyl-terminal hydrolase